MLWVSRCSAGVVTAIYRGAMDTAVLAGLPPDALEAARDTLGCAIDVAGTLGEELRPVLISVSRRAFVEAFRVAAVVAAAIALMSVIATTLVLGDRNRTRSCRRK